MSVVTIHIVMPSCSASYDIVLITFFVFLKYSLSIMTISTFIFSKRNLFMILPYTSRYLSLFIFSFVMISMSQSDPLLQSPLAREPNSIIFSMSMPCFLKTSIIVF